jgi:glycosyltransferase involved in cell wall biosynthesis
VVLHGSDVPGYQPRRFRAVYPLVRPRARAVWRAAHRCIAVSHPLADLARQTWPEGRFFVIGNGVDTVKFTPAPPGNGDGSPLTRILAVAQLVHRKGLHHLADALGQFPDTRRRQVALEIYGTGPEEHRLRRTFARTGVPVAFRGMATGDELAQAFRKADVFVMPSLEEGLPLALLEAMGSGLPVVATAVGGIPEVVRHGVNGLLVEAASARLLGEALEQLVMNVDQRKALGAAARDTAEAHGWDRVWQRYRRVLEDGGDPSP